MYTLINPFIAPTHLKFIARAAGRQPHIKLLNMSGEYPKGESVSGWHTQFDLNFGSRDPDLWDSLVGSSSVRTYV